MNNPIGTKTLVSVIVVAVSTIAAGVFLFGSADGNHIDVNPVPKAVIIDQLYDDIPNRYFSKKATDLLVEAGYNVEIVTTQNVTVDFYRKLPLLDYKFVVVRTHGAVDNTDKTTVTLFTGEKYDTERYITEQLFGQVKKGIPMLEREFSTNVGDSLRNIQNGTYEPITLSLSDIATPEGEYFAITPTFVDTAMHGEFSETVFVLGGCKTMNTYSLAESLVKRGASSVVGWDNPVSASDNDVAMIELLEKLLKDKMHITDAMDSANTLLPIDDMHYPARLKHFSETI